MSINKEGRIAILNEVDEKGSKTISMKDGTTLKITKCPIPYSYDIAWYDGDKMLDSGIITKELMTDHTLEWFEKNYFYVI